MPAGRGRETIITDDYVTDDEINEKEGEDNGDPDVEVGRPKTIRQQSQD